MGKKKASALQRVKNLIIQEPAAVPELTGDENPNLDLDTVSNHSATPSQEDSPLSTEQQQVAPPEGGELQHVGASQEDSPRSTEQQACPEAGELQDVHVGEPLVQHVGTRRQRAESNDHEADDAPPPAAKRRRAYLPEVGVI